MDLFGPMEVTGSIEWEVADFSFLQFLIGAESGAGTDASPYVLTEAEDIDYTQMSTFKMEVTSEDSTTDDSDVYTGCHLTEGSLSWTEGETLKGSASFAADEPGLL